MRIAVYGSRRQEEYAEPIAKFMDLLARYGEEVVMHRKVYDVLCHLMPTHLSAVRKVVSTPDFTADAAISLGGDGTFLRTAMWVGDKQIPILGINTGHLGYLSGATIDELPQVADELARGSFLTQDRSLLQVVEPQLGVWPFAINEVAVQKEDSASMIVAQTRVNGSPLADYRADGLLLSTPTGSTAYNLSVGGPIIQPTAPVWVLSPIAAHSLSMRPLVVSDDARIEVTVTGRARYFRLTLDGRATTLPIGSTISLRKAPFVVKLIQRPGHEFPSTLREKLHWSE